MLSFRTLVGNPDNQRRGRLDRKELIWPWTHIRPPFWIVARDDPMTNYYRGRRNNGCRFVAPCASMSSGSIVRIRNLVSRQELNGQVATRLRWIVLCIVLMRSTSSLTTYPESSEPPSLVCITNMSMGSVQCAMTYLCAYVVAVICCDCGVIALTSGYYLGSNSKHTILMRCKHNKCTRVGPRRTHAKHISPGPEHTI